MLKKKKLFNNEDSETNEIPFAADVDVKEADDSRWVDEGGSLTTVGSKEND